MSDRISLTSFLQPLALNILGYKNEEYDVFFEEEHEQAAGAVDTAISQSLATGQTVELDRAAPKGAVLMGFHLHAGALDHEVAMVAWTHAGDEAGYSCIAATTGTIDQVALPHFAARPIAERAQRAIPTTVLLAHNHPARPARDFVVREFGLPLGPSSEDRGLVSGLRNACASAGGHVRIEGWLLESDVWRPIRLAPAEAIVEKAVEVLDYVTDLIERSAQRDR